MSAAEGYHCTGNMNPPRCAAQSRDEFEASLGARAEALEAESREDALNYRIGAASRLDAG
jgi:hypothetical protein